MRKNRKRIPALLLALALVLSLLPTAVFAAEETMSEEFKAVLNGEGQLEIRSAPPTEENGIALWLTNVYAQKNLPSQFDLGATSFNTDYTKVKLYMNNGSTQESHEVPISYIYEETTLADSKEYIASFPSNSGYFYLSDKEFLQYLCNGGDRPSETNNRNYLVEKVDELSSFLHSNGFSLQTTVGSGDNEAFITTRKGTAYLDYYDAPYFPTVYFSSSLGAWANHAIYVPVVETENTLDSVISAAKKLVERYAWNSDVTITLSEKTVEDYKSELGASNFEAGGIYHFMTQSFGGYTFDVTINGTTTSFVIIRDAAPIQETPMSDEFKAALNEDGAYEINAAIPTAENGIGQRIDWVHDNSIMFGNNSSGQTRFSLDSSTFSSDLQKIVLTMRTSDGKEERHFVPLAYNYDPAVATVAEEFAADFPTITSKPADAFVLTDLEYFNYLSNYKRFEDHFSSINHKALYCSALKAYLGNSNFTWKVSSNKGDGDGKFFLWTAGIALLMYKDTAYFATPLGTTTKNIIYVPMDTDETPEALIAAALERVNGYFGKEVISIKLHEKTVADYLTEWGVSDAASYSSLDLAYLDDAAGGYLFDVTVNEQTLPFAVIKTDDLPPAPTYENIDVSTSVGVSTPDASVPLDTVLDVDKVSSGSFWEWLMKHLHTVISETYDLTLYSASREEYITKLESGKFKVSIPVSPELQGKKLVAYYVDENEKITEYEVTVSEDGKTASFLTDHFSAYTLGVPEEETPDSKPEDKPDETPDTKPEDKPDETPDTKPEDKPDETPDTKPEDKPDETPDTKPEDKPDETPDTKPEDKPEDKPENKPADKSEVSVEIENVPKVDVKLEAADVLTEEELAQGVDVELNIVNADKTVSEADKNAVLSAVKENGKVSLYLDITLHKLFGDDTTAITELDKPISITIALPEGLPVLAEGLERTFTVICVHNGVVTELKDLDNDPNTVTFLADRFSTYALSYVDSKVAPPTGDMAQPLLWLCLLGASTAAMVVLRKKQRA